MFPGTSSIDAVAAFLIQTLRRNWCHGMQGDVDFTELRQILLDDLNEIKEDLAVLRDADRNVASQRFVRGVDLIARQSMQKGQNSKSKEESLSRQDNTWREDLTAALDSAEQGYHRVKTVEEKIMCFEIMCSCFLLLRPPESALYSIFDSIRVLLKEQVIDNAFQGLRKAVVLGSPLSMEHCELLELALSRLCGIVAACEGMSEFTPAFRALFRAVFRDNVAIKEATNPSLFPRWTTVEVYKYSKKRRVAGVTAHAMIPVVPVLAAVGTIMSAGMFRPKNAGIGSFDTIPLRDRKRSDQGASLFEFRWALLDLAHGATVQDVSHRLGRVSLTLDSSSDSWNVVAAPSDTFKSSVMTATDATEEGTTSSAMDEPPPQQEDPSSLAVLASSTRDLYSGN